MITKRQDPTIGQANLWYFIVVLATLAGSAFLRPLVGAGVNLWINELVFILSPALLLAKLNGWTWREVYRCRRTSNVNRVIAVLAGVSMWFFVFYIARVMGLLVSKIGMLPQGAGQAGATPPQVILLLVGMVVLAPVCEEIFFRGFVQRAYEGYGRRYAFALTACLFGGFHILNGMSDVLSACVIGLVLGCLVHRTGSIGPAILAHTANNISAVLFAGILFAGVKGFPLWLHLAGWGGLAVTMLLLTRLKVSEPEKKYTTEDDAPERAAPKQSLVGRVFLVLSILLLLVVGAAEWLMRLGRIG